MRASDQISVAIAALLFVGFGFPSPRPTPSPAKASHEPQEVGDRESEQTDADSDTPRKKATTFYIPDPIQSKTKNQKTSDGESEPAPRDWVTWFTGAVALFTLFLVIVGLLQFIAMGRQARYMRRQARYMRQGLRLTRESLDITRRAANAAVNGAAAAGRNADAAIRGAEVAEKALEISERAYLNAGKWEIEGFRPDSRITIGYTVTNTGRTRCHVTEWVSAVVVAPKPPTQPDYANPFVASPGIVHPGHGLTASLTLTPMTPEQYERLRKREDSIFVFGKVLYADIFEKPRKMGFIIECQPFEVVTKGAKQRANWKIPPFPSYSFAD